MDHKVGPWKMVVLVVQVYGPTSYKINFESFGPLTRCKPNVDQEQWPCTKKWMCWFFFKHDLKGYFPKEKNIKFDHSLVFIPVKCLEDVACKSPHNNFYKKNERFNLYILNVIYMWHVPCVATIGKLCGKTAIVFPLRFFWPSWFAVAKWLQNFLFHFPTVNFEIFFWGGGVQYTVGKVFSRPFQWYIASPQIPKITVGRPKKTNMHSNSWVLDVPHCVNCANFNVIESC